MLKTLSFLVSENRAILKNFLGRRSTTTEVNLEKKAEAYEGPREIFNPYYQAK